MGCCGGLGMSRVGLNSTQALGSGCPVCEGGKGRERGQESRRRLLEPKATVSWERPPCPEGELLPVLLRPELPPQPRREEGPGAHSGLLVPRPAHAPRPAGPCRVFGTGEE